eukprot:3897608-Rhodomonas_salina.1
MCSRWGGELEGAVSPEEGREPCSRLEDVLLAGVRVIVCSDLDSICQHEDTTVCVDGLSHP